MRKLTILALVAMLAVAGSAFAAGNGFGDLQPNATFPGGGSPTTTNNDDSCDIGTAPAATLLLPYFEVDIAAAAGQSDTTLFTITNVSRLPQIAHVTLWTDWSFPVLDFNIFLTGYDVQSINLYDVLVRRIVAPPTGTSSDTKIGTSKVSPAVTPAANTANPLLTLGDCAVLPGELPPNVMAAVRSALTTGIYNTGVEGANCGAVPVGGVHTNAIGYVTVDVADNCSTNFPDNPNYIANELLFDNVLIGDYQQIDGDPTVGNFAQGNPMVHIRAIPEGGPATASFNPGTNLPFTFYDRYTLDPIGGVVPNRRFDRRQPLPALWAARWIQGGAGAFNTNYKIWREGLSTGTQSCDEAILNSDMPVADIIRFDEAENSFGFAGGLICSPCGPGQGPRLPETSARSVADTPPFPQVTNGAIAGWMYLNLNNGGTASYSVLGVTGGPTPNPFIAATGSPLVRPSQNWVIVSMFAQGRYSVDFDAAWLGNGCSAAATDPATIVGPAGGVLVCPAGSTGTPPSGCTPGVAPFTGTNATP